MKLGTILVPLDGSVLAEAALPKALELAAASGARVLLLRAAQAQTLPGVDPTEAQVRVVSEAEAYLAEVQKRLAGGQGGVKIETSVWYGPAAHAIVEAARTHRVDEIVMTTHGRSGLGRLLLGSVAESVLRGTTTPILLLRAEGAPIQPPGGKANAWERP
jgi:nucleotide-binding universal stress UspA family protein